MPTLFVSSLILLLTELCLFGLLWLQLPIVTLLATVGHFAVAALAAYWLSQRWTHPNITAKNIRIFAFAVIALLPIIGSVLIFLIDNRQVLREQGFKQGLGSEKIKKETPQDQLNYFSAPDQHTKGNVRNTRDLLSSLDDEDYLGLLIASRHLSDKEAYALLSDALYSPFESARLMAYSLRGKLEDKIAESREEKLISLKSAHSSQQKIELHLALAQDYLHVLDVGIESGDKSGLMIKAREHCIHALKLDKNSRSGFKTLSKILRSQGNLEQAKKAEQRALAIAA